MINLLIVDSDLEFVKKIINQIVRKNENIRLINVSSSTTEALDVCKCDKPQLVIIDADIINILEFNNLDYSPYFLFFTNSSILVKSNDYLLKNFDIARIQERISDIISKKDFDKRKSALVNTFGKLKFNLSRVGTKFLIESILYSYETKNLYLNKNLERNVYPEIAKRNNTTPSNVKWVIIKSINEMYDRNYIENSLAEVCRFFYYTDLSKPTAKIIINTMLAKLENNIINHNDTL